MTWLIKLIHAGLAYLRDQVEKWAVERERLRVKTEDTEARIDAARRAQEAWGEAVELVVERKDQAIRGTREALAQSEARLAALKGKDEELKTKPPDLSGSDADILRRVR